MAEAIRIQKRRDVLMSLTAVETTAGLPSRLDMIMFDLAIWAEQQRATEELREISRDVLGDTDLLTIDGDYFTVTLPNGQIFRRLLIKDGVDELREEIARMRQKEV